MNIIPFSVEMTDFEKTVCAWQGPRGDFEGFDWCCSAEYETLCGNGKALRDMLLYSSLGYSLDFNDHGGLRGICIEVHVCPEHCQTKRLKIETTLTDHQLHTAVLVVLDCGASRIVDTYSDTF